jgi:hypothetical protein
MKPEVGGLSQRDQCRQLVRFIGVHGAVSVEQTMAGLGLSRPTAYRRVAWCIDAGLLQRLQILREGPSLLRATRRGLRFAGQSFPVALVPPGSVDHWLRCTETALQLAEEFGADRILSERELRQVEQGEERPTFSAQLGEYPNGVPRLHRPDLAIVGDGLPIVVEVELSRKAPKRLQAIIKGWRRAHWVSEVRYYCEPGRARAGVERAIEHTRADERVRVFEVFSP